MMLDRLWDMFLAGFISFQAIGAMGVAQTWTMLAFTTRMGIDTSVRAMVSRAVGFGDVALANHAAMQGFTLSGIFLLVSTFLGVLLTEPLLYILGVSEDIVVLAAGYMRLQFVAQMAQGLTMMSGAALIIVGIRWSAFEAGLIFSVFVPITCWAFIYPPSRIFQIVMKSEYLGFYYISITIPAWAFRCCHNLHPADG